LSFEVFLHPKAARFLKKADPSLRKTIREVLVGLANSPEEKGEHLIRSPFWRLRVGDYRVIYEIDREHSRVVVLFIGHRRDVYDEFSRLL
jgi:mRNA interferase RelE/StbE